MAPSRPDRPSAAAVMKDAQGLSGRTAALLRMQVMGRTDASLPESNALDDYDYRVNVFNQAGALEPEYPPEAMEVLYYHSTALQPCVASYEVNIDGAGFKLVPKVDLSKADADQRVADQIYLERTRLKQIHRGDPGYMALSPEPTPQEIAERKAKVEREMRIERLAGEQFFRTACVGMSYIRMRRHLRHDVCVTGNSYMEVLRDSDTDRYPQGEISRFRYLPSRSMRLTKPDARPTTVDAPRAISLFTWETVPEKRYFRRYVQIVRHIVRHFKEFGDPRTISREDGKVYPSIGKLPKGHKPASEVVHFKTVGPGPYGVPIWAGSYIELLGARSAAEGNYLFFENGTVAAGLLLVSGPGEIPQDDVDRIEERIQSEVAGKAGWGKWVILQAKQQGAEGGGFKIAAMKLTQESITDALWQKYDEAAAEKTGQQFRLPPQLRGKLTDANKSNTDGAIAITEEQVYQPERDLYDSDFDQILMAMGIRYHDHRTSAPSMKNPEALIANVTRASASGAMTINEVRKEISLVMNFELAPIKERWADLPLPLALAEKQNLGGLLGAAAGGQDVAGMGGVPGSAPPEPPSAPPPANGTSEAMKRIVQDTIAEAMNGKRRNGFVESHSDSEDLS